MFKLFKNQTAASGNKSTTICRPRKGWRKKREKERQRHWWETRRIRDKERWRKRIRERCGLESNPYASLSALITLDGSEKHGTMAWPSLTHFHSPGSVQMIWSGRSGKNTPGSHHSPPTGVTRDGEMSTLETRLLQLLINPDLYREDGIIQCKVQSHHPWRRCVKRKHVFISVLVFLQMFAVINGTI